MDPDNSFETSPELPQPQESGDGGAIPESRPAAAPETQIGPPLARPIHPSQPATQQASNPLAPATVPAAAVPPISNSQFTQHLIADDADLIEKEWVLKAKAIVMHTKDDPHKQNQEVTKVKADYLKKRYNKDLKASES